MRLDRCLQLPGPAASRGLLRPARRQALFLSLHIRRAHVMTRFSGGAEGCLGISVASRAGRIYNSLL